MTVIFRSIGILVSLIAFAYGQGIASGGAFVIIDYPGIVVILDEEEIPLDDADSILVEPGIHRITLYFPPRESRWLPPVMSRPFDLKEDERLVIREDSIRHLTLATTPAGAEIHLDDRLSGVTPLSLSLIQTDRTIRLAMEGYRDAVIDLEQIRDRRSSLIRALEPLEPTAVGIDTGLNVRQPGRPWPNWIPYATLTYFVTSTALGFYDKSRADDTYDDYRRTSSRDEMDRLFDRAETLDNRARIFWVTGQVALSATIYLLVRNYRIRSVERPLPSLGFDMNGDHGGTVYLSFTFGGEAGSER